MAEYTMELRQIVNSDCHQVFDFKYPFYCESLEAKQEFEELFINRYYFHEIGAETVERWQHQLRARLMTIMPYYAQLYQTEWSQVTTKKLMMNSKNLVDTFERVLTEDGMMNSSLSQSNHSSQSSTSDVESSTSSSSDIESSSLSNSSLESSATASTSGNANSSSEHKESSIEDGVSVSLTDDGYLTLMSEDTSNNSSDSQSSSTSDTNGTEQKTSSETNESQITSSETNESQMNVS